MTKFALERVENRVGKGENAAESLAASFSNC